MIENLCQADEAESHAKSEESTRTSNVGNPTHLFRFPESLRVGLLYEDVYDCQVTLCIVVYFRLHIQRQTLVGNSLSPPSDKAQWETSSQW